METTLVLVAEKYHKGNDAPYFLTFFLFTLGTCFPQCVPRMCTRNVHKDQSAELTARVGVIIKQDSATQDWPLIYTPYKGNKAYIC